MTNLLPVLFFQDNPAGSTAVGAMGTVGGLIALAIALLEIAAMWRVFTRAGQPGWAAIVPIYNMIVFCRVGGKPGWWFLILWLVVPWFLVCLGVARNFGKGAGFGIGLALLSPIFLPVLAWGDSKYSLQPAAA